MKKRINKKGLVLLLGLLFTQVTYAQRDQDKDDEFHLDKTYQMNATGTLNMSTEDADIRIVGSKRSDVHVKIDRVVYKRGFSRGDRKFEVDVEERNGDLFIRERRGRGTVINIGSTRTEYEILVELPEGASLRIKGEDDDYYVKNVNGKIDMESEDGDMELVDCKGDDFQFVLEDGDLKIDGGNGRFYARLDDGDLDVINGDYEEVEVDIEDGSVRMETSISNKGEYELKGDDARIEFVVLSGGGDFKVIKDDGRVRASSEFETIKETDYRSELKLPGGSANVQIRTNDGSVRLSKR